MIEDTRKNAAKRLNVNLSAEQLARMRTRASRGGTTVPDLVRAALGLMERMEAEVGTGNRVSVTSADGLILKEFVFPGLFPSLEEASGERDPDAMPAETALSQEMISMFPEIAEAVLPGTIYDPSGRPIDASESGHRAIVSDLIAVSDHMLSYLWSDPTRFHQLTSRQFEEVVSELLIRQGYSVELTPPSRDGGLDIFVAKKDSLGSFLYLVECKRFSPNRPVGVQIVRGLYGVVEQVRATAGIIATTSTFTSGAEEWQRSIRHRMALKDFYDLRDWLELAIRGGSS